jgi:hypothetical protein
MMLPVALDEVARASLDQIYRKQQEITERLLMQTAVSTGKQLALAQLAKSMLSTTLCPLMTNLMICQHVPLVEVKEEPRDDEETGDLPSTTPAMPASDHRQRLEDLQRAAKCVLTLLGKYDILCATYAKWLAAANAMLPEASRFVAPELKLHHIETATAEEKMADDALMASPVQWIQPATDKAGASSAPVEVMEMSEENLKVVTRLLDFYLKCQQGCWLCIKDIEHGELTRPPTRTLKRPHPEANDATHMAYKKQKAMANSLKCLPGTGGVRSFIKP